MKKLFKVSLVLVLGMMGGCASQEEKKFDTADYEFKMVYVPEYGCNCYRLVAKE